MVFPDSWIIRRGRKGMIEPFMEENVGKGVMSFGVSSYGYDFVLADEFRIFRASIPINPKKPDPGCFTDFKEFRKLRNRQIQPLLGMLLQIIRNLFFRLS